MTEERSEEGGCSAPPLQQPVGAGDVTSFLLVRGYPVFQFSAPPHSMNATTTTPSSDPPGQTVQVNGVELYYHLDRPETGNAALARPPVVLLHGWPETSHAWHRVVPELIHRRAGGFLTWLFSPSQSPNQAD